MTGIDMTGSPRVPKERRERRSCARFPLNLEIQYSVSHGSFRETGSGRIIDIGRSGLRFAASEPQVRGHRLEVAINWPVLLDGRVPLQLIVIGPVVWSSATETAMRIRRHTFKTRGAGLAAAAGIQGQSVELEQAAPEVSPGGVTFRPGQLSEWVSRMA
jgi:hypothetical protein